MHGLRVPRQDGRSRRAHSRRRLAFVHSGVPADKLTESAGPFWVRRVYQTLRELGDVEGSNLVVERFSAEGRTDRFASLAAEVVSRKPDVILLNHSDLAKAFMVATSTIPLVVIVGDPVAGGLLTNLTRPGGRGLMAYAPDLGELAQRLASDVHQIFDGTKAGDIPFYLPNTFQLIVNSKAAKALGLELPPSLLARADEMIE